MTLIDLYGQRDIGSKVLDHLVLVYMKSLQCNSMHTRLEAHKIQK